MDSQHIMVLGLGNILFADEGFGVHVIKKLKKIYEFPDNVSIVDGGVLGLNLLGIICQADYLIVVDAIRNGGKGGSLYRLEGDAIPERIRAKNSLHQIDFIETLTLSQVLNKEPKTIILGIEPEDIKTLSINLTPTTYEKIDKIIDMILAEFDRLGVSYQKGSSNNVSRNSIKNYKN
jgi:hydrogenase maturation protease